MLRSLYIENLAVISRANVALSPGFNVFTGETGAGKTILIGAIGAVLGARVSKDIIRTGENKAVVTALFCDLSQNALTTLGDLGYAQDEEGTLLITRVIKQDATECRIGGRPATAALLKELAPHLIDVHGQHDNDRLLSPDYHLTLIDSFGGLWKQRESYKGAYLRLLALREELGALSMDEGEKARRIDLLEYQIGEIQKAELYAGEEEELAERHTVMRNAERVAERLGAAKEVLDPEYGEQSGLLEKLAALDDALGGAARYLSVLEPYLERVSEMKFELSELSHELTAQLEGIEYSPQELDACEARRSLIHALKTKYGQDIPEILAFYERAKEELEGISLFAQRQQQLEEACAAAQREAQEKAAALTKARQAAGERFIAAVENELRYLDMPSVSLLAHREERPLGSGGADFIELLIAPNAGETPRPMHKIASGGEIARIMLSIKNAMTGEDDKITSVFDEVDSGVSGRAADKIGQKLAAVAAGRQVLCVTHLAQVAAYADCHLLIQKNTEGGRTFTDVRSLENEERVGELARIVSGDAVTKAALQNAAEMLRLAQSKRK